MRINVYSQELTDEVNVVEKESSAGLTYSAVQIMLHSSEKLHHPPKDDDRSAVTFWLPRSPTRREDLARTFEQMAAAVRNAKPEVPPKPGPYIMDAPGGPRCWCGKPSRLECGACSKEH